MFNKFLGYFRYRKIINQNFEIMSQRYRFRYDRKFGRLYTVLNVTEERQEVLKTYGYDYLDNEVKKYIASLEEYFLSIGLLDLISISRIDSLDPVNVLVVLRYKYKTHQTILYTVLGLLGLVTSIIFVTVLVKFLIFLVNFIISL
jgi:predicted enzyme involved in methoxymalonyl-ACP biosynthesis